MIKQDLARATAEIQRLQTEESEAAAGLQRAGTLGGNQSAARRIGSRARAPLKTGTAGEDVGPEPGA